MIWNEVKGPRCSGKSIIGIEFLFTNAKKYPQSKGLWLSANWSSVDYAMRVIMEDHKKSVKKRHLNSLSLKNSSSIDFCTQSFYGKQYDYVVIDEAQNYKDLQSVMNYLTHSNPKARGLLLESIE